MNARDLLTELAAAGVHLCVDGNGLKVRGEPGVSLAPWVDCIRAHKPALRAELLQIRIVAVVTVPPEQFDRPAFDALWRQWHTENAS